MILATDYQDPAWFVIAAFALYGAYTAFINLRNWVRIKEFQHGIYDWQKQDGEL